jgi:hypothetical protein
MCFAPDILKTGHSHEFLSLSQCRDDSAVVAIAAKISENYQKQSDQK